MKSCDAFDLDGLGDDSHQVEQPQATAAPEPIAELEAWADGQLAADKGQDGAVVFDIETGPRAWSEIECLYEVPAPLPPWDDSMVKYGNAKKEELREQKLQKQRAAYQQKLDSQTVAAADDKQAWLEKAALSPLTGRVLLIGLLDNRRKYSPYYDEQESLILELFWDWFERCTIDHHPMIGHNSNGFDLPFLVRRSWYLGVPVPREVFRGRYWNPLFRDTMEQWNCGQRNYVKLNTLGQFFGVGQKTEGVEGKDFSKLWFGQMPAEQWGTPEEQRAKAIEYNGQDLKLTAAVAAKMGMM